MAGREGGRGLGVWGEDGGARRQGTRWRRKKVGRFPNPTP